MDVATTIIIGVSVFVSGQLIIRLLIQPVEEMKATMVQVSHIIIECQALPKGPALDELGTRLVMLSAKLETCLFVVPCYSFTAWFFRLPSKQSVLSASGGLLILSFMTRTEQGRSHFVSQIKKRRTKIQDALGLNLRDEVEIQKMSKDMEVANSITDAKEN